MGGPAIELRDVDRRFGAVHAVDSVSLAFEAGSIHAVVGENGAGKSTLLRIAAGLVTPDRGHVLVAGERLAPHTPREAIARGVGMVQQHFALVGVLSAIENVMLGSETTRSFGRLDVAGARSRAEQVAREMGVSLPWDAPVETLGVGDRQRLEIVRTLVREARVVILDEPTAVLTPGEADQLYATLRRMTDTGHAVVVVTHRLDEVRAHADHVSVMRRGKLVSSSSMTGGARPSLAAVMRDVMGEAPPPPIDRRVRERGAVRLKMTDVRLGLALRGVTLDVRAGEIVGIAGVDGNGQRELVRILAGLDVPDRGDVRCEDVAVAQEDRHVEGLVLGASVEDNLVLGELARFSRMGVVDGAAMEREARARMDRARVVPPDLGALAATLSGGNQQKIVVARAIARALEGRVQVLVFAQPTRGVDLGAAHAIHAEIAAAADAGHAVLVVSADLAELRVLCDRLLVMARGRIVGEFGPDAPDARFGDAMLIGAGPEQARA